MYKIIILLLCLIPTLALAKKSYPPYPEVWGYDISDDFNKSSGLSFDISRMKNGDYILYYPSLPDVSKAGAYDTAIHFFEGAKRKFSGLKALSKYMNSLGEASTRKIRSHIVLKDGKIIDVNVNNRAYMKHHNNHNRLHYYYIKRIDDFENGNADYELSAIGIATFCEDNGACKNWAYFLAPQLLELKDDTFFAFDDDYYLFIRFDRDFKTKFKPQRTIKLDDTRELKSNFYVIPYSKVEYFFDHLARGILVITQTM